MIQPPLLHATETTLDSENAKPLVLAAVQILAIFTEKCIGHPMRRTQVTESAKIQLSQSNIGTLCLNKEEGGDSAMAVFWLFAAQVCPSARQSCFKGVDIDLGARIITSGKTSQIPKTYIFQVPIKIGYAGLTHLLRLYTINNSFGAWVTEEPTWSTLAGDYTV